MPRTRDAAAPAAASPVMLADIEPARLYSLATFRDLVPSHRPGARICAETCYRWIAAGHLKAVRRKGPACRLGFRQAWLVSGAEIIRHARAADAPREATRTERQRQRDAEAAVAELFGDKLARAR